MSVCKKSSIRIIFILMILYSHNFSILNFIFCLFPSPKIDVVDAEQQHEQQQLQQQQLQAGVILLFFFVFIQDDDDVWRTVRHDVWRTICSVHPDVWWTSYSVHPDVWWIICPGCHLWWSSLFPGYLARLIDEKNTT